MNIIITSEQRVGSRWIHYLLCDLYGLKPSPEKGLRTLRENPDSIRESLAGGKIAKFHGVCPEEILRTLTPIDYRILSIVRNPRDRLVSLAFHHRYHGRRHRQTECVDDMAAVRLTVREDSGAARGNVRQLDLMKAGYSTRRKTRHDLPYIWTAYEWLLQDETEEIRRIAKFLGSVPEGLDEVVRKNSFEKKSGRTPGTEERGDLWRRKGVSGDYLNWFDEDLLNVTAPAQRKYLVSLARSGLGHGPPGGGER